MEGGDERERIDRSIDRRRGDRPRRALGNSSAREGMDRHPASGLWAGGNSGGVWLAAPPAAAPAAAACAAGLQQEAAAAARVKSWPGRLREGHARQGG